MRMKGVGRMERDQGGSLLDDGVSWCGSHTQCEGRYIWETSLSNHMDGSDTKRSGLSGQ